jgi:hypothetical protein
MPQHHAGGDRNARWHLGCHQRNAIRNPSQRKNCKNCCIILSYITPINVSIDRISPDQPTLRRKLYQRLQINDEKIAKVLRAKSAMPAAK